MARLPPKQPKVLVFDLDYTLWPFWVDTHVNPPFKKNSKGHIVDSSGSKVDYYPGVDKVLQDLNNRGFVLAVASRTGEIRGAQQLIELFGWDKLIKYKEIFPGGKVTHLTNIKKASDVEFGDMIFFDDETRNIIDVSNIGVMSIMVRNGVTQKLVDDALNDFALIRQV